MAEYDNTNTGILTKNDKDGNEKRPDYRGSINVNGQEFWLSAWIKAGRDGTKLAGQKYMSLTVQPKDSQPSQHQQDKQNGYAPQPGEDDDIPF